MSNVSSTVRKRTAVLVVHGIGSQRALETVGGVVRAVWYDDNDPDKRIWTHPEESGVDLDLSVMTTSKVSGQTNRSVDFHELYWAHLMSETRSVAVLLWLFELGRKGPRFKEGMNGLWWGVAIFLCLMLLTFALFALKTIVWATELTGDPQSLLTVLILMLLVGTVMSSVAGLFSGKLRLAFWAAFLALLIAVIVGVTLGVLKYFGLLDEWKLTAQNAETLKVLSDILLPLGVAVLATKILMGGWGLRAFAITYLLSLAFFCGYLTLVIFHWAPEIKDCPAADYISLFGCSVKQGKIPWSLTSGWSAVAGWVIVAVYLVVNASFLQPYLGDAARYFRNSPANVAVRRQIRKEAVDTLDALHRSGSYDRIIVVAHSLGSVVAYDMLRAYYGRIHQRLPEPRLFGPELTEVDEATDSGTYNPALRTTGRRIIGQMLDAAEKQKTLAGAPAADKYQPVWLVTDFITVGAALTHAYYLMCLGDTPEKLRAYFEERTREREYPTCPPLRCDNDGLLTFMHWKTRARQFHHGGLFGMTRWTNLYFQMEQLFWGDAIGGALAPVFGSNVLDVKVSTKASGAAAFFTHTAYWDIKRDDGRKAPHIVELCKAVNLEDKDS